MNISTNHSIRSRGSLFVAFGALLFVCACSAKDTSSLADAGTDLARAEAVVGEVNGEVIEVASELQPQDVTRRPPRLGPPQREQVSVPTVEGPISSGNGSIVLMPPGFDLSVVDYVEEEFFLSGNAASYTAAAALDEDGVWDVLPDVTSPYVTRVIVRRPEAAADFSGTVVVEWFNVSGGLDAAPDWTFTHNQVIRQGNAWVGVSAQEAGIEGGGNPMGAIMALKNVDPVRYGPLDHPGDDFSYDIFTQAGSAVWFAASELLGGLEPTLVLAVGESQSAFRLTTYINAVAPLVDVFDGYLVHSRAAFGAPLGPDVTMPQRVYSRTDLEVPVLVLSTETDLVKGMLAYGDARQPDSQWFASWEIAGTAHVDAYGLGIGDEDDGSGAADLALFEAMQSPPSSVYFGVMTCDLPINAGPQTYVARAALAALERWAWEGIAPPSMPLLELDDSGTEFVRDNLGNAVGGIRTPQVDAPIATLSGLGQAGGSFCALFGTTMPLDPEQLAQRYLDDQAFVNAWNQSLDTAVGAGAILPADALRLGPVAQTFSPSR